MALNLLANHLLLEAEAEGNKDKIENLRSFINDLKNGKISDINIDKASRILKNVQGNIKLEFAINLFENIDRECYLLLYRNFEQVVPKESLDDLWQIKGSDSRLRQTISRMNKTLIENNTGLRIKNHHGQGYSLIYTDAYVEVPNEQ